SEDDDKLKELDDLVKDLNDMKEQTVSKRSRKEASKSHRTTKTMLQRVTDANEKGKIVNVSNWKSGDGYRDVRVINKPAPGTTLICVEGLALASSVEEPYARAIEELGDDYQHFLDEYKKAAAALKEQEAKDSSKEAVGEEAPKEPKKRAASKRTKKTKAVEEPKSEDKEADNKVDAEPVKDSTKEEVKEEAPVPPVEVKKEEHVPEEP